MRISLSTIVMLLLATCICGQTVKVTHVSDGDSFIIASGARVRMIGVDAPEIADNFGRESKEHLASLIRGRTVMLERDPLNEDRDIHGRLLRFVRLNGTDINLKMIADGYAGALLRYPFTPERQDAYRAAEASAKVRRRGIWAFSFNGDLPPTSPPVTPAAPEPPRVLPKLCSGAIVLLLVTFLGCVIPRARA